jgi:hypothetical protein
MPLNFIEPFDFFKIYVTSFLGDAGLFPFFFIIVFSFVSASFQFTNTIFIILLTIGLLMFGAFIGFDLYILVLFVVGFFLFKMFSRIFQ